MNGMKKMAVALAAATTFTVHACTPAQNGNVEELDPPADIVAADSRITMERSPCFGTCPVYEVEITGDGVVTFTGHRFVDSLGTRTHRIQPSVAAALVDELVAGGFFELADGYTRDTKECGSWHTDAPSVTLTVSTEGREKTVEHYHGCADAPPELRTLEQRVDSVAGVARWVGHT